jgi:hypothetical protein
MAALTLTTDLVIASKTTRLGSREARDCRRACPETSASRPSRLGCALAQATRHAPDSRTDYDAILLIIVYFMYIVTK